MVHFTPERRKRKDFFPKKFHISEKIYPRTQESDTYSAKRGQKDPADAPDPTGKGRQGAAKFGTQGREIGRRPQAQPKDHIQPDLTAAEDDAAEKQRQTGQQPEEQVQPLRHPGAGAGQPELTQQVIQQPDASPQQQARRQRHELAGEGEGHPRNSRPNKLWRGSSSS